MRAIPRFLAPSILKSSQRGKFAPEPSGIHILKWIFLSEFEYYSYRFEGGNSCDESY